MFELQPCNYYAGFSQCFLHIMVRQNPKKSNAKEITFFYFIQCDVKVYLCQKYLCHNVLKNANILKKGLK
jgi:hypothetical protein